MSGKDLSGKVLGSMRVEPRFGAPTDLGGLVEIVGGEIRARFPAIDRSLVKR
jgi:hypothetical protein